MVSRAMTWLWFLPRFGADGLPFACFSALVPSLDLENTFVHTLSDVVFGVLVSRLPPMWFVLCLVTSLQIAGPCSGVEATSGTDGVMTKFEKGGVFGSAAEDSLAFHFLSSVDAVEVLPAWLVAPRAEACWTGETDLLYVDCGGSAATLAALPRRVDGSGLALSGTSPPCFQFPVLAASLEIGIMGLFSVAGLLLVAGLAGFCYCLRSGKGKTHLSCVPWSKKSEDTKTVLLGFCAPSMFQVSMMETRFPLIVVGRGNVALAAEFEAVVASAGAGLQQALDGLRTLVGIIMGKWHIVCAQVSGFSVGVYGYLVGMATTTEGENNRSPSCAAAGSVTAAAGAAAAAAIDEQPGVCQEVSVNALQAKATARVDVPETSKHQGYGVELEETEVKKSFPVFLRTLQGRHQVLSCCADMLVADLYELVADSCHMHCDMFVLVHQSKIVERSGALGEWGIKRDATLTLTLRMLGGSGIPGEWHCALCNRGGCWHTKAWCFRCGTSRAESEAILRGSAQGFAQPGKGSAKGKGIGKGVGPQPQREQRYPGRPAPSAGPQFSHAPTFHAPRPNKRKQADSSSPQLNALPQVVEVLKMLGCSQDVLDMVQSKVDEQTKAQHKVPGEKERMLHVLKMKLTKAKAHLAHLQSVEKKKEEEYAHARELAVEQARYLADIQSQHDQAWRRVVEGSVVDSATSEVPILEEISGDEAQFEAMSDDDPDLAPKEWTQPEKRAQPEDSTDDALDPPPPPKFPRVLPAKIECTDAERAQVQAWDINSVQAMHNWCQERLAAACQATPEG